MERSEARLTLASGRRIGVLDRGPRDGRPVLYLHGSPGSRHEQLLLPDAVLDAFKLRIVSIDRPGWGATTPLIGDRVARSADALEACDVLGIDAFDVMAFSAGGSYAVALAVAAPSRVSRLVLASAQMPYDDETVLGRLLPDQRSLLPALRAGRNDALVEGIELYRQHVLADPLAALQPSFTGLSHQEHALLEAEWFNSTLRDEMVFGLAQSADGLVEDLLAWPCPFEFDVTAVRCPVRAIHGTNDDWEPIENLRRILRTISDAQLIALEGLNHLAPHTYPYLTMSLLM